MLSFVRMAPWRKPGGLLLLGLLALSCASTLRFRDLHPFPESQGHYIPRVPFLPQEESRCGPAALTMVLRYWGASVSEEEIARETYLPALRGTLLSDLKALAIRQGFRATSYASSPDDLRFRISKDEPVILLLDRGRGMFQKPHYVLAIGFHEGKGVLVVHSGRNENQLLPYGELTAQWARMNYLALLIVPQDHP